jgi:hypothetical protein
MRSIVSGTSSEASTVGCARISSPMPGSQRRRWLTVLQWSASMPNFRRFERLKLIHLGPQP